MKVDKTMIKTVLVGAASIFVGQIAYAYYVKNMNTGA